MDHPKTPYWLIEQPVMRTDIQAIDPAKLIAYLKAKGWEVEEQGKDDRAITIAHPLPYKKNFRIVPCVRIPKLTHWADYERHMADNVGVMCRAEGRLAADILADIASQ